MSLNKEELKEAIEKLPLFEKREVLVKKHDATDELSEENWTKQTHLAICEIDGDRAYAYTTPDYKLLQFKDVFLPVVNSIPEEVKAFLAHYGGYAYMKFFPEIDYLKEGDSEFGLVAVNSVDMSSSIIVKFCVLYRDHQFTIPPQVAGLKKQHTGKVENITRDYISMVGKVKELWKTIITTFPKYKIVTDANLAGEGELVLELQTILDTLKLGVRLDKTIHKDFDSVTYTGSTYTLWDLFIKIMNTLSERDYKSDVHREKKIDKVCQSVFQFGVGLSI